MQNAPKTKKKLKSYKRSNCKEWSKSAKSFKNLSMYAN